jgi:hypothetical protein
MSKAKNIQNKADWTNVAVDERLGKKLYVHDYRDLEKLQIVFMGDEHEGSKFYDRDTHIKNIDWCLETKSPIILMGDQMETATKESVGAGVYEQEEIVQEQLEKTFEKYKPVAKEGLLLGNHIGNHEARVYNSSGANLSKILAQMLNINYLGIGAAHYFMVGDQRYTAYTTHGSSGARMPHTKIANTIKMASMIDVEIYAQGHLHQLSHHVQNYYNVNRSKRQVEESQKHYLICGSYLKHWGSYAQISNYEPARIGSPKVKLGGLEHTIRVSL